MDTHTEKQSTHATHPSTGTEEQITRDEPRTAGLRQRQAQAAFAARPGARDQARAAGSEERRR